MEATTQLLSQSSPKKNSVRNDLWCDEKRQLVDVVFSYDGSSMLLVRCPYFLIPVSNGDFREAM